MPRFETIPVKCNTKETWKLITERDKEVKDAENMGLPIDKIVDSYKEELSKSYKYVESDINVDMIIGYYLDAEDDETVLIKTVAETIVTSLSIKQLRELINPPVRHLRFTDSQL